MALVNGRDAVGHQTKSAMAAAIIWFTRKGKVLPIIYLRRVYLSITYKLYPHLGSGYHLG